MSFLAPMTSRPQIEPARQPRAEGAVALTARVGGRLGHLRQSASLKALFPRTDGTMQVVLVNTAGGATGGDQFLVDISLEPGAELTVTTQAAERAYRAQPGEIARLRTRLTVGPAARLTWLPQEMLLFEGAALDRALCVDLADAAELVLCETLVFGRTAMGESVHSLHLRDRIEVRRNGTPLFLDQIRIDGDAAAHLARPTVADGACAMALLIVVSPQAEAHLNAVRKMLPETAGASLIREDLLAIRLLARDSFLLRQSLNPILCHICGELPKPWKI